MGMGGAAMQPQYNGAFDCLKTVLRQEGFLGT